MPANRMNRDQFYSAMAPNDDGRLRKILWTVYWRGNALLRERIEDELRSPEQPKVKPKKELPDPDTVLDAVTTFVKLAKDGAYMAGDRRVHHTERSKWRLTFRRLAGDALAALQADDPGPAQQAVAEMVDLACETKGYDYFHSDDPVEAAKFVVSDAVAVLWESVLRHDGFAAFARRVPEQLIRWEAGYGWTRQGYGQVPEKETALAVPLAPASCYPSAPGSSVMPLYAARAAGQGAQNTSGPDGQRPDGHRADIRSYRRCFARGPRSIRLLHVTSLPSASVPASRVHTAS
jgi:hypothetical protein